jgi:hypothetical protein
MAAGVGWQGLGMYNNAAYVSFIVVQTNKIMNEVQTYNRQGMNNVSFIVVQTKKIMNEARLCL